MQKRNSTKLLILATVLALSALSMTLNSCEPAAKVILLDKSQLYPVEPNKPYTPEYPGWYIENRAFKRLFQELRIEDSK